MFFRRTLPIYRQAEAAECGLACVGMIAAYWGKDYDLPALRRRFPVTLQGATLNDLIRVAKSLELNSRALKLDLGAVPKLRLPAILHWEFNHFVVLAKVGRDHVIIHDPAVGRRRISLPELSRSFTGVALELQPAPEFRKEREHSRISLLTFFRQVKGLAVPLVQMLVLSLLLQLAVIVMPFYTQMAIDHVVPSNDKELLKVFALGFGLIYLLRPVIEWLRSRLVIYVSTQFSAQLTSNLVRHLLSLPLPYFEKRSIGDLLTRLDASDRLRDLLVHGFVTTVVDVLLGLTTLAMMFYYSVSLGVVVLITMIVVLILRLMFVPNLRMLVNETLQKKGQEQAELIESLRGITSVKFALRETEREAIWNNRFTSFVNSSARMELNQVNYNLLRNLTLNIGLVVVIYMGIREVMDPQSSFTLGAFFAFAAYRDLFFQRLNSILDQLRRPGEGAYGIPALRQGPDPAGAEGCGIPFRRRPGENLLQCERLRAHRRPGGARRPVRHGQDHAAEGAERRLSGSGRRGAKARSSTTSPSSTGYRISSGPWNAPASHASMTRSCSCPCPTRASSARWAPASARGSSSACCWPARSISASPCWCWTKEAQVLKNLKELGVTLIMTAHKSALRDFGTQLWELDATGRLKVERLS